MYVTVVTVHVNPEYITDFIAVTRINHEASVRETGNLRFDVLQSADDPACFILYEAYRSAADAARHKETDHYLTWRDQVATWMAAPRQGQRYTGLFPNLS
jgi:autoinducer 2-degrading protein